MPLFFKIESMFTVPFKYNNIGRKDIFTVPLKYNNIGRKDIFTVSEDSDPQIEELSVDEILNGIPGSDYQVKSVFIVRIKR